MGKACRREVGRDELLSHCDRVVSGQRSGQAHTGAPDTFRLTTSGRRETCVVQWHFLGRLDYECETDDPTLTQSNGLRVSMPEPIGF